MENNSMRSSLLGEQTAENDHKNLLSNFIETPEYKSILENKDCSVVVGRRGTGKSAMFFKLNDLWNKENGSSILRIAPEDYQTIKFTSIFKIFQDNYSHIKTASRLIWKYGLYMEVINFIANSFRTKEAVNQNEEISQISKEWNKNNRLDFFAKITLMISEKTSNNEPEDIIFNLGESIKFKLIEKFINEKLSKINSNFYILIDRLDEGYENNETGLAIISGIITAGSEINKKFEKVRAVIFQRDNIIRSISKYDPDYTRNIEGEIIRIHWDTYQLFNLVTKRLNTAFNLQMENSKKIWDRCTANEGTNSELKGDEGFKKCLQFTLYRPRDLLSLLNQAFYNASREGRHIIILSDIEKSAKNISQSRLDDLIKEYSFIIPSVKISTNLFENRNPELTYIEAISIIDEFISSLSTDENFYEANKHNNDLNLKNPKIFSEFIILKGEGILKSLYSIGFFGKYDKNSNVFTFCHDGSSPDSEFNKIDKILIHPCYWIALNLSKNALKQEEAEQINDEYEIKVSSLTPKLRDQKIGSLIASIGQLPEGRDYSSDFENWMLAAIQTAFAGRLTNIQIHPNRNAVQRRDIIGTNLCLSPAWKRIREDYSVRQVIFEIKNYKEIGADEYRQMSTYLHDQYGNLGFIVTRDHDDSLRSGKDLNWTKEIFDTQKKVIIKLSYKFFTRMLSKLRSQNQKHDFIDEAIIKILDMYERNYLGNQTNRTRDITKKQKT